MPVVEYYERKRKLAKISAVPPPDEVSKPMSFSLHGKCSEHCLLRNATI